MLETIAVILLIMWLLGFFAFHVMTLSEGPGVTHRTNSQKTKGEQNFTPP